MAFNTEKNGAEQEEFGHISINYSGPSFSDLPRDFIVNVLLSLSVNRILACKFVCKTWYDIVSDPVFAKVHFDQTQAYPLIRISGYRVHSRMLYLVQPEEEDFELKFGVCYQCKYKSKCDCRVEFELKTNFKLPLRNLQMIVDDKEGTNCIEMKYHDYLIVNSCNGLLCLSSPSDNDPLVVCNPITSEFISLPKAKKVLRGYFMRCGFGYSPATNQYKVIRMFHRWTRDVTTTKYVHSGIGAEVHTLGTETWKDINISAQTICGFCPTYLNGYLFWPCHAQTLCVLSFDIKNECFESISAPSMKKSVLYNDQVRVGVLGGELFISCYFTSSPVEVWVLKDYGTRNEWVKLFSVQSHCSLPHG